VESLVSCISGPARGKNSARRSSISASGRTRVKGWKKLGGTFAALLQMLSRREIKPLAGTSKLAIIDHLVRVLRKARYTLSADVKQHKEYVGAGRPGRFVLSKDLKP
jgi:hypothetical protein